MQEFSNLRYVVGQIVHYQRMSKGWTQQQLADACDLKRTTISNIESGGQSLSLEQFCLIMNILGTKPSDTLSLAMKRLSTEKRWHTVKTVVTASKVKEGALRNHILEALK